MGRCDEESCIFLCGINSPLSNYFTGAMTRNGQCYHHQSPSTRSRMWLVLLRMVIAALDAWSMFWKREAVVKGLLLKSRMRCSPVYKPKKAWYLQSKVYLPDQVDRLEFILKEKRTFVDERYWFSVPDCAQLASDTFNIPIKVFSFDDAQGNILFFTT